MPEIKLLAACPVCELGGGFHDKDIHNQHEVPRDLVLAKDWHKPARGSSGG